MVLEHLRIFQILSWYEVRTCDGGICVAHQCYITQKSLKCYESQCFSSVKRAGLCHKGQGGHVQPFDRTCPTRGICLKRACSPLNKRFSNVQSLQGGLVAVAARFSLSYGNESRESTSLRPSSDFSGASCASCGDLTAGFGGGVTGL
jgi:hypothetical protein